MILHLIETGGPGGAEQMLLRLADEYGSQGHSQVVCLRKEGWLAEEVRKKGFPLEIRPLRRLPDLQWFAELRRLVRSYGVTAIHSHEFAMNIRSAMMARWLKIPSVATVHGKGYYGEKWTRRLAYGLTGRLTNMVAVSEDIQRHLTRLCKLAPSRISVIPNGVDTRRFRFNEESRHIMRSRLGVGDDHLLLGTVGSYYPVKGHRFLIDAMRKLAAVAPGVRLVMAGQGPLADELQQQARKNGLESIVQIAGYIEDTPGLLSALDIFVMPSLSEGQPLALLEAGANGRCIVASNTGGIPEILVNGENGILVPPGDVDALADALLKLVRDPGKRKTLGDASARMVEKSWSIRSTADTYLQFLFP